MGVAQSGAAASPHWEKLTEVVWASALASSIWEEALEQTQITLERCYLLVEVEECLGFSAETADPLVEDNKTRRKKNLMVSVSSCPSFPLSPPVKPPPCF